MNERTLTLLLKHLLLAFLVCGPVLVHGGEGRHWVGGSGSWSDPAHWSATPGGRPGASVPRSGDDVVIAPSAPITITLDREVWCKDLLVDGCQALVTLRGTLPEAMRIGGDWIVKGAVRWELTGRVLLTRRQGHAAVDVGAIVPPGDVVVDGGASWSLASDLKVAGDLVLLAGTVVSNGVHITCEGLRVEGRGVKRLLAGNSVIEAASFHATGQRAFVEPASSALFVNGTLTPWDAWALGPPEAMRGISVCGTGAGQTPFTVNAQLVSNYNGFGVSCHQVCDGVVTVSIQGGVGPFTIQWQGGPTTNTWNGVCPGNQIVIVTDLGQNVGCAATVQVTDPSLLGVIFFPPPTPPTCADVCNGSAGALAVGGAGGYTYNWNNGAGTGSSFNQLCAGVNTITVTDANGCAFNTTINLPLAPIAVNLTTTDVTCAGGCDGTGTVAPSGGTGTYTITWNPAPGAGQGTPNATGLCAGNYAVTVVDANGCDTTVAFTITEPPPIEPGLTFTPATCSDVCDGTASVAPTGALGPFVYSWTPAPGGGAGTPNVSGLCPGLYSINILDQASGCDTTVTFEVTSPGAIDAQLVLTDATCSDGCDGTATVAPVGGTPGFTYLWTPAPGTGQGTASAGGLCPGGYTILITDAVGCDTLISFTIGAPPPIDVQLTATDATCSDACDGTAQAVVSGGTPGYTYLWTPAPGSGQGSPNAGGLCPGTYTLTVSDQVGCDTTITFQIAAPPPLSVSSSFTNVTCGTNCDGTAGVVVGGGTPGYTYVWTPAPGGGQGTADATGLCAGVYAVLIADANGCDTTVTFTILDPAPLAISLNVTDASCPGACDGSAGVIVTGGTPGYSYVWDPAPGSGQGTDNVTGLCPGAYLLTVTDAVGCDTTIAFTINAPPPIEPNATVTAPTCPDLCNGSIVLAPSGGTGSYTYTWVPVPPNGNGTASATGLCAGPWQVTITSGACDTTLIFDLQAPPPIDVQLTATDATCSDACDGTAQAVVSGGTPGYTYLWTPAPGSGQGSPNAGGLCPGTYTLTVSDQVGCDTTITFQIAAPPPFDVLLTTTLASCGGACDGTAEAIVSGSNGGYQFDWQPPPGSGQGTSTAGGLCPGIYSLTITDALGCDTVSQFIINTPSGIQATALVTPPACSNTCDGAIELVVQGGLPPYTFNWTPTPPIGDGTGSVAGLCAGDYAVVIGDQAGCDTVLVINVPSPPVTLASVTFTNETCNGPCDGTATVSIGAGIGPFQYLWTPTPGGGQGTPSVTGLCAGITSVVVTDGNGCDTTLVFEVLPEQPIQTGLVAVNGTCHDLCDGTATVSPSGGTGPYTIQWLPGPINGQGTDSIFGLCAGNFTVIITDANGCSVSEDFPITKPGPLSTSLIWVNESCTGPCTGGAQVFPFGGNGGYTFFWSPEPGGGQGTSTAFGLCAGTYTITLADSLGCDTTESFTILPFQPIVPNLSSTPVSCTGLCDGTATVGPVGATPPYTYFWSPEPGSGQGTPQATGLCAGVYTVLIEDVFGCDTTVTVLITSPSAIDPVASVQPIGCGGVCDGSIVLSPIGGTAPYQYTWVPVPPNGQGSNAAFNLCAGLWSVTVTDDNGCDTTVSFTLVEPDPIVPAITTSPSQCQVCIGEASAVVTGGTPGYTFAWIDGNGITIGSDSTIAGLCAGVYSLLVTDASGCTATSAVVITDSDGELLTMVNGATTCTNTCDGSVAVQFVCSDPPCSVAWFDALGNALGLNTDTISGLCPGIWLAQVTNASGCISIDTAFVVAPDPLTANISSSPETCVGACDGTAAIAPQGGTPPYITYDWTPDPPTGDGTPLAAGLCSGVYEVLVTDANGCPGQFSVLILGPPPVVTNEVVQPVSCPGQCDASIVLNPTGGAGGFGFFWSPVPPNGQGTNAAFNLCAGNYQVVLTDANGCDTTIQFVIPEPDPLVLTATATTSQCQVCDGSVALVVSGGQPAYDIQWTDGGGTNVGSGNAINGLCAGIYIATVTDAGGCTAQLAVPVQDSDGEQIDAIDGQTTCANLCDGTVSVTYTCSDPPCVVNWVDDQGIPLGNSDTLTNLCAGSYYVLLTNASGCVSIDTAVVTPSTVIIPNLSSTPVSCAGDCDGTATVGPVGGLDPYSYDWAPDPIAGDGTPQATGLCAGVYSVTIQDQSGCDTTVTVLITEPQPLLLAATVGDVSCNGVCDGSIVAQVQGGVAPYLFSWSPVPPNGDGTNAAFGLCAGDHTLTVTDANGCVVTTTWTIAELDPLVLSFTSTPSECGLCIGEAAVQVQGGTPAYTWSWTLGGVVVGADSALTGLCAGLYTATVQDQNGCLAATLVPIADSNGEVLTTNDGSVDCPGDCDGEVSVDLNCSDPPCTITWTDAQGNDLGQPTNTATGLCAGTYLAVVVNASGCISIDTALVVEPDPIQANLSTTATTCAGVCDGTATVGPTGGNGGYSFDWSPDPIAGDGTPQVTGLCAGAYDVLITDSLGCALLAGVLILEPDPLTATANVVPITCNAACDGSIVVTPFGGNGGYQFQWLPVPPNGDSTNAAFGLCAGLWSVLITDVNGCDTTLTFELFDPPALTISVAQVDNLCFGDCLGEATATILGGVPPYAVEWQDANGVTIALDSLTVQGLCAGDVLLIVTDSSNCVQQVSLTIGQGAAIDAGLLFTNETCFGPCDGTAAVSPTGGAGGFSFLWQPQPGIGQGTDQVAGLCPDNWSVTITDQVGCDTTVAFTILPFQPIAPNALVGNVNCAGACDGSILLQPAGGFGNFTFQWTPVPPNGDGTPDALDLCAGDWTVVISDGIGCDTTITFSISEPLPLVVQVDLVTDASCNTATDGAIDVTIAGGVPGYGIGWTGPDGFVSTQEDIAQLAPGDYTLTVNDANGCTISVDVTVAALVTVVADAGADIVECTGVALTLDGSGSTGGQLFTWTTAQGDPVGTGPVVGLGVLPGGTYTYVLTVTDGVCSDQDTVTVTLLQLPIANAGPDQTIFLNEVATLGGAPTGPLGSTFQWSPDSLLNDATLANPIADPPQTSWFTVTVTAPNGCVSIDSVLITVLPDIVIPSGFTPNGDGWNDVWQIDLLDLFPNVEVEIYSRWGELLFQSVGYRVPWDGRYKGGLVPVGTYYYVIRLNDPEFPEAYTGPLTVIR